MRRALSWVGFLMVAMGVGVPWVAGEPVVVKGSDTLGARLMPRLREVYATRHPEVDFVISSEGSTTGIQALIEGQADLAMSSRDLTTEDRAQALVRGMELETVTVAYDGIAVIVSSRNPLSNLRAAEVEAIFTGQVEDWSAVRGKPGPISVYSRNTSSGTYASFKELAMRRRDYSPRAQKLASNEQIASEVAHNVNGVGYVGLAFMNTNNLKIVSIGGVFPTAADIRAGHYPLARPLYLVVDKKRVRREVRDFIEFVLGSEGQEIVAETHFVAVRPDLEEATGDGEAP